jgi:iron-sulfur cluster repair protein YtfE (RIC family)
VIDGFRLLQQDHREVERLFAEYETSGDPMVVREICFQLVLHTEAEEAVLYPAVRSLVTDGAELASRAEFEHQQVKDDVARLYDAAPADVAAIVHHLRSMVEAHVSEEERELLPLLADAGLDARQLGDALVVAKERARPDAVRLAS